MGRVIRAYRLHPAHGRPLAQERVGELAGITQAQLSRIETGPPILHLDRLIHWARLLRIPPDRLWFTLPGVDQDEDDDVNRGQFLRLGVAVVPAAMISSSAGALSPESAAESLAWELWQRGRVSLHPSELAAELAAAAARSGFVVDEPDGTYALADPRLIDFFVAKRIFGGIIDGDPTLFASAQTSADTDHVLRRLVGKDARHPTTLTAWMRQSRDGVLRVNAAGVLGKLGHLQATTAVLDHLRRDADTRARYVTAVTARVLGLPWSEAAQVATGDRALGPAQVSALADEAERNAQDAGARWCSLAVLSTQPADAVSLAREPLQRVLRNEPAPEVGRAAGGVLAGVGVL